MSLSKFGSVAAASAIAIGAFSNAGAASAALIGDFAFVGLTNFSINAFDFAPVATGTSFDVPGDFNELAGNDFGGGAFAPGTIADLCQTATGFACSSVSEAGPPAGTLDPFLTFTGGEFILESLGPVVIAPGVAFTSVDVEAFGFFREDGTGIETSGSGLIGAEIPNSAFGDFNGNGVIEDVDLLGFLAAGGSDFFIEDQPYSANFTAVPEPATTVGLVAAGLMGAATRMRKKKAEADAEADA